MVKNYISEAMDKNARVPLILGIWGGKGQGKSFQTELAFKKMGCVPGSPWQSQGFMFAWCLDSACFSPMSHSLLCMAGFITILCTANMGAMSSSCKRTHVRRQAMLVA